MKGRILLVDDNEDFLDSTKDVMEEEGYEITTACSGEEALRMVGSQPFDLVVMDIKMPGMNGVDSFIAMKRVNPRIRVIMCTAYIMEHMIHQALEEGAHAVLNKPFEMDLLFRTVESALQGRHRGRILLADRDEKSCEKISDILRAHGHKVIVARYGPEAVTKAGEHEFDVLVLDVGLPLLDGTEVYHRIKSAQPLIWGAIISGFPEEIDHRVPRDLKREKGVIWLNRPLEITVLLDLLESMCAKERREANQKPEDARP